MLHHSAGHRNPSLRRHPGPGSSNRHIVDVSPWHPPSELVNAATSWWRVLEGASWTQLARILHPGWGRGGDRDP